MSIRRALAVGLLASLFLAALVYGLLPQTYGTNDDVAIRLLLEGRMFPDSQSTPFVIFINLALAQGLTALYRIAPTAPWYDIFEQGLFWLSCLTILYVVGRGARTWARGGVFACVLLALGCTLVEIQFTTVAMTAALAGCLAIVGPFATDEGRGEVIALRLVGPALLIAGAALRLEAVAMILAYLAAAGMIVWLARRAPRPTRRALWRGLAFVAAFGLIGALWVDHFRGYAADAQWLAFFTTNSLRGAIQEYAPVRASPAAIAAATRAAGWTSLDYELLMHSAPLDPNLFSTASLQHFLAALPALGKQLDWVAAIKALAIYPLRYWYLGAPFLALAATRVGRKSWPVFVAINLAFLGLVLVTTLLLKPLPHHVFWPLAAGHLLILALVLPKADGFAGGRPVAVLVGLALVGLVAHGGQMSRKAWTGEAEARAYLTHHQGQPGQVVVIFGGSFPYEYAERPFRAGVLQRQVRAVPTGVYSWSPLARAATGANLSAFLCAAPQPEVLVEAEWVGLLPRFYAQERGRAVVFSPRFTYGRITAYQCVAEPTL